MVAMPIAKGERVMIKDLLTNTQRYQGLPSKFQEAFAWLEHTDLSALSCGRHDIAEGVFANVAHYTPVAQDQKQYEQHFAYADVQVLVEGSELIAALPCDAEQYRALDKGDDCVLSNAFTTAPSVIHMNAGEFCILWPGEAHKPGLSDGVHAGEVFKIVVKVAV